ncbi:MAG: ligand-gated channel protein [Rhodospirillales bacterium]|nr:ligand-gated channel protein [Rhodospirillales bacterium]
MSGHLSKVLCATTAIIALIDISPAKAQSNQTAVSAGEGLEEVIVTARRREEVLQTTPVSVSAISGATLDRLDIHGVDKIGQFIPNVASVATPGFIGGSATDIRGIGDHEILITEDPPVGQYLDGVYIAGVTSTNFDLVDVQRVEVLRGPQGTLFGRNTTGGAINIVTKTPSDDFGIEEKFIYGSYDELAARTEINTGAIGDTGLKAILAYQHRQRDGYVDNINTSSDHDPGALRSDSAWFKLHGDWGAFSADYSFDFDRLTGQSPYGQISYTLPAVAAYFGQSPALGGSVLSVNPNYTDRASLQSIPDARVGVLGHALTLQYDINSEISVKSITGYRQFWSSSYVAYAPPNLIGPTVTGIGPVTPYEGPTGQRLNQASEELQVLGKTDRWNYVVGLYYFHDRAAENEQSKLTFVLSPTLGFNVTAPLVATQSTTSEAAFGQTSYRPPVLDDKLEITTGLRYTHDSKSAVESGSTNISGTDKFYNLSYNVTLNYQWTPDLMTYARLSTGYRSGGFNLRATPGISPNFAPEKAKVYEAGVKSEWLDHRLRVNLAAFHTNYEDLQVSQYTGYTLSGGNSGGILNAAADYTGFELEAQVRPIKSVTIDGSIGYVHPEYQKIYFPDPVTGQLRNYASSAHFSFVPNWTDHLGVQYEFPEWDFGTLILRADYSYQSAKYFGIINLPTQNPFTDLTKAPSQNLVSARLTLADVPIWGGKANLETSVFGENLLDEHYIVQSIDFGPSLGFATKQYGVPRTFGFDIKVKY